MSIGMRNAMLAGGAALPYDAEVEYLESTGTQWIDTGVVGNDKFAIDVKWSYVSTSANSTQWGARTGVVQNSVMVGGLTGIATDERLYPSFGTSVADYNAQSAVGNNVWECRLENGRQVLYKDGALVFSGGKYTGSFTTINTITLFAIWNSPTQFLNRTGGRIWLCKIWQDGAIVRDFIPVRVGSGASAVGYMYDRVSGTLFGNAGTGAFVIGPDASAANRGGV